jgi:hypothetical protein
MSPRKKRQRVWPVPFPTINPQAAPEFMTFVREWPEVVQHWVDENPWARDWGRGNVILTIAVIYMDCLSLRNMPALVRPVNCITHYIEMIDRVAAWAVADHRRTLTQTQVDRLFGVGLPFTCPAPRADEVQQILDEADGLVG